MTAVTTGLSFNAEITYNNDTYNYFVTIEKNGNMKITSLKDNNLSYFFCGNTLETNYDNLTHKTILTEIPEQNITDFLYLCFKTLDKNKNDVLCKDNNFFLNCKNEKYRFKIYIGSSGMPLNLTEENFKLNVVFSKCKLI